MLRTSITAVSLSCPNLFTLSLLLFRRLQVHAYYHTARNKDASVLSLMVIRRLANGKSSDLVPNPFCYLRDVSATVPHPTFAALLWATEDQPLPLPPSSRLSPSDGTLSIFFSFFPTTVTLRLSLSLQPYILSMVQMGILPHNPIPFTRSSKVQSLAHTLFLICPCFPLHSV